MTDPCPICGDRDGFHRPELPMGTGPHAEAARRIPAHLIRQSNSAVRREQRELEVAR